MTAWDWNGNEWRDWRVDELVLVRLVRRCSGEELEEAEEWCCGNLYLRSFIVQSCDANATTQRDASTCTVVTGDEWPCMFLGGA